MKKYIFLLLLAMYFGDLRSQIIVQSKEQYNQSRASKIQPSTSQKKHKTMFENRKRHILRTGHRIKAKKGFPDRDNGKRLRN